jgi:hypothetical protein
MDIADVTSTFTVSGPPAQVSLFRKMLAAVDLMCAASASRTIEIEVDGDGATQLEIHEGGARLSDRLSDEEAEFYVWREMRPSTPADTPLPLRDYSISWRLTERGRVLVVELDGCGPSHETDLV